MTYPFKHFCELPAQDGKSNLITLRGRQHHLVTSMNPHVVARRIQGALDALETWYRTWGVKVYSDKSATIIFTKRHVKPEDVSMLDPKIHWVTFTKYLAVIMEINLTWRKLINSINGKSRGAMTALIQSSGVAAFWKSTSKSACTKPSSRELQSKRFYSAQTTELVIDLSLWS